MTPINTVEQERRHGMDQIVSEVSAIRQWAKDHESSEFRRYDEIKESIKDVARCSHENQRAIQRIDQKISGWNGWMLGFGAACATFGGVVVLLFKKAFSL